MNIPTGQIEARRAALDTPYYPLTTTHVIQRKAADDATNYWLPIIQELLVTVERLADQQAMPDDFYRPIVRRIGDLIERKDNR